MFYTRKKKNQIRLLFFIFFLLGGCSSPKENEKKQSQTTYFAEVPIVKYSIGQTPCISAQLQGKDLIMELDLGFCGGLDVPPTFIERLKDKEYSRSRKVYVVTGKEYQQNVYIVKRLDIGSFFLEGKIPIQDGYHKDRNQETIISLKKLDPSLREDGRIGWHLFSTCALLIDCKQSKVAFADSFQTLKNHGYFKGEYGSAPLLLDRELPEIELSTSLGNLRCIVDTGATMSIIHREIENFDLTCIEKSSVSCLNQYRLKPLAFRPLWIKLPISVEAILGMDFFTDHLVVLDFGAARIYVQRYEDKKTND